MALHGRDEGPHAEKIKNLYLPFGFGTFLATVIDFVLVALIVFAVVKAFNKAREMAEKNRKAKEEEAAPAGPTTEELLAQIPEELKSRKQKMCPARRARHKILCCIF